MKQTKTARRLQNKVDEQKDRVMVEAIFKTDISGLTKEEAAKKLENAIKDSLENVG